MWGSTIHQGPRRTLKGMPSSSLPKEGGPAHDVSVTPWQVRSYLWGWQPLPKKLMVKKENETEERRRPKGNGNPLDTNLKERRMDGELTYRGLNGFGVSLFLFLLCYPLFCLKVSKTKMRGRAIYLDEMAKSQFKIQPAD